MTRIAGILLSLVFLFSCETEIDVFREKDTTPVVWCLLDQDQEIQTLRLSRSYVSFQASIPPDSPDSVLLSQAIEIALEQVNGDIVEKRAFFEAVEIEKDSGFFPSSIHWIYQTDMMILPDTEYKLIIYHENEDKIVYSTCTTVTPFDIANPKYPELREIQFHTSHNPQFYWTRSENAGIFQMGYIFHYDEFSGDFFDSKELELSFNTTFVTDNSANFYNQSINSNQFYIKLKEALPADPGILRRFKSMDAFIVSGGQELAYLIKTQTGGQTFSLMEFTNIYNGIGVFSSRMSRRITGFKITDQTLDSLAYGRYTNDLNFLDRNGVREEGGGK